MLVLLPLLSVVWVAEVRQDAVKCGPAMIVRPRAFAVESAAAVGSDTFESMESRGSDDTTLLLLAVLLV